MWIVRCSITGEYLLGSKAKIALANKTNPDYAKRYHTLSGAKTARASIQLDYDYFHEAQKTLFDRGHPSYVGLGRDYYLRKFEIIEI